MTAVPSIHGVRRGRPARLGPTGFSPARTIPGLVALIALVGTIFVVGQTPFRHLEALTVAETCRAIGFHGIVTVVGSQILLSSPGQLFWVDITPSCSSLGPALAITLIAIIMSAGNPPSDRLLAGLAGVASIVLGNFVRIGSSVVAGLVAGRVSLVLFHDWVGSTFGFGYTVGGFVLMLAVLLRRRRRRQEGS